ncbi:MAG: hypothetical protein ACRCS8_05055 [Brevinema sp.]
MKKILLLIVFFSATDIVHAMSKKPEPLPEIVIVEEVKPEAPVIITKPFLLQETYDRTTKLVHYDIMPFEAKNFSKETGFSTLIIQPSISRHSVNGNADLHLWIGFTQEKMSPNQAPFRPEFLVLDTLGKEVRIPISYKETTNTVEQGLQEYRFKGYAYLFDAQMNSLLDILSDGQEGSSLTKQHRESAGSHVSKTVGGKAVNPAISKKQKMITLSLSNNKKEITWEAIREELYMILDAIHLRQEVSSNPLIP